MTFKSQSQRRKFAELLVEGKISPQTYEEWNRETGKKKLPERVKRKVTSRKRTARKITSLLLFTALEHLSSRFRCAVVSCQRGTTSPWSLLLVNPDVVHWLPLTVRALRGDGYAGRVEFGADLMTIDIGNQIAVHPFEAAIM